MGGIYADTKNAMVTLFFKEKDCNYNDADIIDYGNIRKYNNVFLYIYIR